MNITRKDDTFIVEKSRNELQAMPKYVLRTPDVKRVIVHYNIQTDDPYTHTWIRSDEPTITETTHCRWLVYADDHETPFSEFLVNITDT